MSLNTRSLEQWVDYIQTLHHSEIELGLERVSEVYRRLYPDGVNYKVVTVAGTNGKGSTCELLASIYRCEGYRVGKFSSPHLIDFGERYQINRLNAAADILLPAFVKIEEARAEIPITFFEFSALLAVELFSRAQVDIAIMEVGLGGRLDAINVVDADVAIITSISIDHTAWLGNTIDAIAYEKAGIARTGKPCVVGIENTPQSIVNHCYDIAAQLFVLGRDFDYLYADETVNEWSWRSQETQFSGLPLPFSQSDVQLSNAALAIFTTQLLANQLPMSSDSIVAGLSQATILARCQLVSSKPLVVLDVAHNESSVLRLRKFIDLQRRISMSDDGGSNTIDSSGRVKPKVVAVCGMLKDKEVSKSLACLLSMVDQWHFATIDNERGASADYLRTQLEMANVSSQGAGSSADILVVNCHSTVEQAYNAAQQTLLENDTLVVFGSFFVAGDILRLL